MLFLAVSANFSSWRIAMSLIDICSFTTRCRQTRNQQIYLQRWSKEHDRLQYNVSQSVIDGRDRHDTRLTAETIVHRDIELFGLHTWAEAEHYQVAAGRRSRELQAFVLVGGSRRKFPHIVHTRRSTRAPTKPFQNRYAHGLKKEVWKGNGPKLLRQTSRVSIMRSSERF